MKNLERERKLYQQGRIRVVIKWANLAYFKAQISASAAASNLDISFRHISSGFNDGAIEVRIADCRRQPDLITRKFIYSLLFPLSRAPTFDQITYYSLTYRDFIRNSSGDKRVTVDSSMSGIPDLELFELRIRPEFELLLNYQEKARWLTVYWEPEIQHVACNDGQSVILFGTSAWKCLLACCLPDFKLGSYDTNNKCVLFNRDSRRFYLGDWYTIHDYLERPDSLDLLLESEANSIIPFSSNSFKAVVWGRTKFAIALAQLITVVVAAASAIVIPLGVGADCIWRINQPSQIVTPALTASVNQEMTRAILMATGLGFIAFKLSKQREQD